MSLRLRTFEDVLTAIVEQAKIANTLAEVDTNTLNKLKRMCNMVYMEVIGSKEWPWRIQTRYMKTFPKTTEDVVDVENGSRIITFSDIDVDDTFKGRIIRFNSEPEWYEIVAVHDPVARKVMLGSPFVGTTDATADHVMFRNRYGMWPDVLEVQSVIPMGANVLSDSREVQPITPDKYWEMVAIDPFMESTAPSYYTIMGQEDYDGVDMGSEFVMDYDFMESDPFNSVNRAIVFYPRIFDESTLSITYGRVIPELAELSDIPYIPTDKMVLLVYGVLKDWYLTQLNNLPLATFMSNKYEKKLRETEGDFEKSTTHASLIAMPRRRRGYWPVNPTCSCPDEET